MVRKHVSSLLLLSRGYKPYLGQSQTLENNNDWFEIHQTQVLAIIGSILSIITVICIYTLSRNQKPWLPKCLRRPEKVNRIDRESKSTRPPRQSVISTSESIIPNSELPRYIINSHNQKKKELQEGDGRTMWNDIDLLPPQPKNHNDTNEKGERKSLWRKTAYLLNLRKQTEENSESIKQKRGHNDGGGEGEGEKEDFPQGWERITRHTLYKIKTESKRWSIGSIPPIPRRFSVYHNPACDGDIQSKIDRTGLGYLDKQIARSLSDSDDLIDDNTILAYPPNSHQPKENHRKSSVISRQLWHIPNTGQDPSLIPNIANRSQYDNQSSQIGRNDISDPYTQLKPYENTTSISSFTDASSMRSMDLPKHDFSPASYTISSTYSSPALLSPPLNFRSSNYTTASLPNSFGTFDFENQSNTDDIFDVGGYGEKDFNPLDIDGGKYNTSIKLDDPYSPSKTEYKTRINSGSIYGSIKSVSNRKSRFLSFPSRVQPNVDQMENQGVTGSECRSMEEDVDNRKNRRYSIYPGIPKYPKSNFFFDTSIPNIGSTDDKAAPKTKSNVYPDSSHNDSSRMSSSSTISTNSKITPKSRPPLSLRISTSTSTSSSSSKSTSPKTPRPLRYSSTFDMDDMPLWMKKG
ncbi:uncharacterized protein L201_003286 [Kwoniella dendrophila CBS 6074]|uniref:Uncharacterized protein n=1 Tax=Kwoniella dendrophila CBS 6074 TaxID=1295534 RepID=A0AAX4JSL7_9TREE